MGTEKGSAAFGSSTELAPFERQPSLEELNEFVNQVNLRIRSLTAEVGVTDNRLVGMAKLAVIQPPPIVGQIFDQEFITSEEFFASFIATKRAIDRAFLDRTGPATPAGISLSSTTRVTLEGTIIPRVNLTWTRNEEPDLWFYQANFIDPEGFTIIMTLPANADTMQMILDPAEPNTVYTVTIRAVDTRGNFSAPSGDNTTTTSSGFSSVSLGGLNNITIDEDNDQITVKDNQGTPQTRVILGKTGAAATDWGARILDASGNIIIDISGLGVNVVGSTQIADLSVTTAKIANLAVTQAKIANLAVDTAQIASLAVETAKIANLNVTTIKIGNNAVSQLVEDATDGGQTFTTTITELAHVAITTAGGELLLIGKVTTANDIDPSNAGTITITLREGTSSGGTILDQAVLGTRNHDASADLDFDGTFALARLVSPGSGAKNYKLWAVATSSMGTVTATYSRLEATELLK